MDWKRSGSVHVCAPYVIEPASETLGVVRYRLTGAGLDELSRSVPKLKELAETHYRRHSVDAVEQRRRESELAKSLRSVEHRRAEVIQRATAVLPADEDDSRPDPDWSELRRAEEEDRARREAIARFERQQEEARIAAEAAAARRAEALAQAALPPEQSTAPDPDWSELARAEEQDRVRRESAELFARRQEEALAAAADPNAEIIQRAEAALPRPEPDRPDWTGLAIAEAEDRLRRASLELFSERQDDARQVAEQTEEQRRAEIIARAEAALQRTE